MTNEWNLWLASLQIHYINDGNSDRRIVCYVSSLKCPNLPR